MITIKAKFKLRKNFGTMNQKKVKTSPVDMSLQIVKNSGPSERKAVQGQIS